jgi:galactonate dehydratase
MKVVSIEQFFPKPRVRLVKITTDNGLTGWGETTLEGRHWQHVYRSAFFRGGNVLMSALSGIDQALWDISGKHFGVPIYQLLGGAVRDRIRVYAHWGIGSLAEEAQAAARARLDYLQKLGGYTAFKSGPGGKWRAH